MDFDSILSMGQVRFKICAILWNRFQSSIHFRPQIGLDYVFIFLLGFGFGFWFIFFSNPNPWIRIQQPLVPNWNLVHTWGGQFEHLFTLTLNYKSNHICTVADKAHVLAEIWKCLISSQSIKYRYKFKSGFYKIWIHFDAHNTKIKF